MASAAILAIGGCADSSTESAPPIQTVTKTVTVTPKNQPSLDCQPPTATLEVTWRRDVGEGMPPTIGPKDIVPHDYAEPFSLISAKVKITNLSPNAIHTRGVTFDAEWIDGQHTVKSTRYQITGLIQDGTGYVPAAPRTGNRGTEQIEGGATHEFSREYRSTTPGDLRAWVRTGDSTKPGPYTWISALTGGSPIGTSGNGATERLSRPQPLHPVDPPYQPPPLPLTSEVLLNPVGQASGVTRGEKVFGVLRGRFT